MGGSLRGPALYFHVAALCAVKKTLPEGGGRTTEIALCVIEKSYRRRDITKKGALYGLTSSSSALKSSEAVRVAKSMQSILSAML